MRAKQERVIEAVRRGLEGDAAVEFICQSGYAMNTAAIARHLRNMGGRGHIRQLIRQGLSNAEILRACFPGESLEGIPPAEPRQEELFDDEPPFPVRLPAESDDVPLYETVKISLRVPADLYEAIRLAAKAENKTQSRLIIEILTAALARMPEPSADVQ
jgi:hypothetical protein